MRGCENRKRDYSSLGYSNQYQVSTDRVYLSVLSSA